MNNVPPYSEAHQKQLYSHSDYKHGNVCSNLAPTALHKNLTRPIFIVQKSGACVGGVWAPREHDRGAGMDG